MAQSSDAGRPARGPILGGPGAHPLPERRCQRRRGHPPPTRRRAAARRHAGTCHGESLGELTADRDFEVLAEENLQEGELAFGRPTALVAVLLVFGSVVAGLVPALLAVLSIVVALAQTVLVGQTFDASFFVVNMITGIGE